MKKSTLFTLLSVASCVSSIVIANLALKSEYDRKVISSYYRDIRTLPFHHIKEVLMPDSAGFSMLDINIYPSDTCKIQETFYADLARNMLTEVRSDTLFIRIMRPFLESPATLNILCKDLRSVSLKHSRVLLSNINTNHLFINTDHLSFIRLQNCTAKNLSVKETNSSHLLLTDNCKIDTALFTITDKSVLSISNTKIGYKELSIGNEASLNINGNMLKTFFTTPKLSY